ncbi:MAG: hypothetical protein M1118_01430, partial [Chloroflexi bacterium]|nr:hypothetical protein [Chloroflexota bacterium]
NRQRPRGRRATGSIRRPRTPSPRAISLRQFFVGSYAIEMERGREEVAAGTLPRRRQGAASLLLDRHGPPGGRLQWESTREFREVRALWI